MVPVVYIENNQDFESVASTWLDLPMLAIDTEFERRTTFYAKLALVQVFDGQTIYLIDPIKVTCSVSFKKAIESPHIIKILHSCKEDLEVLYTEWDCKLSSLFDTQVAYQFNTQELSIGYAKLVEELTSNKVDKQQTNSDWTKRPLTKAQLEYAAIDVIYLFQCYQILNGKLKGQNYLPFFVEECSELCSGAIARVDNCADYRDAKDVWHLNGVDLSLFKVLFEWRERVARTENRTKNHIIRDQGLVQMAQNKPDSINKIKNINDLHPRSVRLYAEAWLSIIKQWREGSPKTLETVPDPRDVDGSKAFSSAIEKVVKQVAQEQQVSPTALLSKRMIRKLGYALSTKSTPPLAWQGWRKRLLLESVQEISKQFVN
jgi:ribonuclease D